jgi:cystathionine gamma-synthase
MTNETASVWAGESAARAHGSTQVPIAYTAGFGYADVESWLDAAHGRTSGHIYSRNTNPTVQAFEEKIRVLEHAEASTSFSSGMAAISNTFFALLSPGQRVVSITDTYGGTNRILLELLPRFHIDVELCRTERTEDIAAAIGRKCDVLFLETPTNPTLKVLDIALLSRLAHQVGATVVVDNTLATPVNQTPLALGADLVVHSASKYLSGHADALGGALCGHRGLVDRVFRYREITGAMLDPMAAYLLIRGLKTLHLRVDRQNASAMQIARWLDTHPSVSDVFYPGLDTHPDCELARRQMRGFGGVLSFSLQGGFEEVVRVLPRLQWAHRAANLGAVETTVGPPATTSHVECTPQQRAAMGIPEGLIRYSVGIEAVEDLLADLAHALGAST